LRGTAFLVLGALQACSHAAQRPPEDRSPTVTESSVDASQSLELDAAFDADILDAALDVDAQPFDDPMAIHHDTRAELLALIDVRPLTPDEFKLVRPDLFLNQNVGPAVTRMNQGNKAISHHSRGQRACLAALAGMTLQTPDQEKRCGGPNMVPIYKHGDPRSASYCIDIFEFPNKPCELPFVWSAPTFAQTMCTIQGKRLCTQDEWSLACRADPEGGADSLYAYGDQLDLDICNTNKPRPAPIKCSGQNAQKAWETCGTDTEPAGSFPKCRSRFGVFDQHGNVAEIMTRKETAQDGTSTVFSQLKGSAFFYAEVSRNPNESQKPGGRETYPDHCNFDPRWHVEPISGAWHVNYHLGFRCCKTIPPLP
jgi:formylglycine-generating enzyme